MKSFKLLSFSLLVLVFGKTNAQLPFNQTETIDVGNISAKIALHGDMWFDSSNNAACEFPKGSGKHVAALGGLWMAGYDNLNLLCVSAQVFRSNGVNYWPGPLSTTNGSVPYATSQDWARIWKLRRGELNIFLATQNHTLANTPATILEWPAKGNPYARGNNSIPLVVNNDMAPFVDVNSDGVYNALDGDYPVMKGDQMLWYVFNDNGITHTPGINWPVMAQLKCMVYAYGRGTLADNVLFYEYEITSRNASPLTSFVIGTFADLEVGYSFDDYFGYDSSRNLGIAYNGDLIDGVDSNAGHYRDTIPKVAIKALKMPSDTCGGNQSAAGSFVAFNNGSDPNFGDPSTSLHFNNYLRSRKKSGTQMVDPNGNPINYYCPDDPSIPGGWSGCAGGFPPYDKRVVLSSQPFTLQPGETIHFAFALLASNPSFQNGCPNTNFADIQQVADTAQYVFCNPLPIATSVDDVMPARNILTIYPNPSADIVHMEMELKHPQQLKLTDALGRALSISPHQDGNRVSFGISHLAPGVYHLLYNDGKTVTRGSFVRE